jgi:hypothetical protein
MTAPKAATATKPTVNDAEFETPWPGTHYMPRWDGGELIDAPRFTWRKILGMLGPGLVMGGAAIGGGEWLAGPAVTAKYGGALLWVALVSILIQVLYNIEISRYTLYSGEPIFTGKFRLPPHPMFWLGLYLAFDWGSVAPYLAVNAAVPLETILIGKVPDYENNLNHWWMHKFVATGLYLLTLVPLIFGGKIYNSLKAVMSFKLVVVIGFLLILSIFFSHPASWWEILSGFTKIGTVPVDGPPGENTENVFVSLFTKGTFPTVDLSLIAFITGLAAIAGNGGLTNTPISNFTRDQGWGMGAKVGAIPSVVGGHGITLSHVGCVFDVNEESLPRWRRWYRHVVRDQLCVWLVACIIGVSLPSILSVEFLKRGTTATDWNAAALTADGVRDQVTSPPRGVLATNLGLNDWLSGPRLGWWFWFGTLFCGFLVMITSNITTMDGFVRRWVDVTWTASARLRELDTSAIGRVYFVVLCIYATCGLSILWLVEKPGLVFKLSTTGYNLAFAFSAWHTVFVNSTLLPKPLRPHWIIRVLLILGGCCFLFMFVMAALQLAGYIQPPAK